jgi:hypothetical protein
VEGLRRVLDRYLQIAFALLFGSRARGSTHAASDVDVAVGLEPGALLGTREIGALVSDLEQAAGRPVDLVILNEAPPPVAYRAFRDGIPIITRNRQVMADRKARFNGSGRSCRAPPTSSSRTVPRARWSR